jgi:hypothetical protein
VVAEGTAHLRVVDLVEKEIASVLAWRPAHLPQRRRQRVVIDWLLLQASGLRLLRL